jgi:NADPH-dependent ferric siderophore reductase
MVRATLAGPELEGFEPQGPGGRVKLALPLPGRTDPPRPTWDPKGWVYPPGQAGAVRTYTIRAWRPAPAGPEVDIDFALHAEGPAVDWIRRARPWVACESSLAAAIRGHLRGVRGLAPGQFSAVGYWKTGGAIG